MRGLRTCRTHLWESGLMRYMRQKTELPTMNMKEKKTTTQITCTLDKENTFILLSFFRIQASQPAQNGAKRAKKKKNTLVKKQNKGLQIWRDEQRINQTITQACRQFDVVCNSRESCHITSSCLPGSENTAAWYVRNADAVQNLSWALMALYKIQLLRSQLYEFPEKSCLKSNEMPGARGKKNHI